MLGIYLVIGAFAGIMSGLLGIGGGIIVIPALEAIFISIIPADSVMQMAIGTSLATMIFTTLSGFYIHFRNGAIRWDVIKQILPPLLVGVIIGAVIARLLPSHYLKSIFGLFLIIVAIRIIMSPPTSSADALPQRTTRILSVIIGGLTSILGAGGGTMIVPLLMRLRLTMHEALAGSLFCTIFISLIATICFMLSGVVMTEKIALSTGYVYWPAFVGISVASVLFAPIGALLAHKLPTQLLKKIFAVFLLLIALDMLYFAR